MTGPASTSAGGTRVVLPAPGDADSTTARRAVRASRTSATYSSMMSGMSGIGGFNGLSGGEAARVEQGLNLRVAAAESAIRFAPIDRIAVGQDVLSQAIVGIRIPRPTGLHERLPRVRRHHVRPKVAVITGGVRIAAEQMIEMRKTVAQHHFARHASDARERFVFERRDVVDAVGPH